uniref:Uncharacterized protein n=1 Tax=Candidatus Methanogaster sp. ANME-2c ERB4 TaxID=2759911 RepID=A0A7G9YL27_9EURY|nr:hypothetical protein MNILOELO_00013 [Methanosarcinales archaeon ANME-2c ERB4]
MGTNRSKMRREKENTDEIEDVGLHPLRCTIGGII